MRVKKLKKTIFENLFLRPKPVNMLTSLRKDAIRYATQVSKAVDCTYSHTVKVLEQFRKLGLVEFEKKGRIKIIKLTSDGKSIAEDLANLKKKFLSLSKKVKESK